MRNKSYIRLQFQSYPATLLRWGLAVLLVLLAGACDRPKDILTSQEQPPIYPDYKDVTIPSNIAPLNFLLRNDPEELEVSVKGKHALLLIRSKQKVQFPEGKWHSMLKAEEGGEIVIQITAKIAGRWIQYAPFCWKVVADPVDPYLSYRLIEPGYEVWNTIQLRERHTESFKERVIADNNQLKQSCMNCHIYGNQDPNLSLFHIRGGMGGMVLNREGKLRKLNTQTGDMVSPAVYGAIHPQGRLGVFSTNVVIPAFHTYRNERLEVYDAASDLYIVDWVANEIIPFPKDSASAKVFRTFPVFSADGQSIYYCEAPYVALPQRIKDLKYHLLRVGFDARTLTFGTAVDTLFNAAIAGSSVSYPKASPDGRYVLYTVADNGTFPIWHREADLQLLDLSTGVADSLQVVNADCSDTYHSWSSNSRWFVFASKRDDGLYGKPYFAYIDRDGVAHKPFVLPQKDPALYDYTLKSFNIPELATGPLPFSAHEVEHLFYSEKAEIFMMGR